ncbi:MAG: hypothetical protein JSR80_05055 [Verrucomicrobia bacterium]|nr:hypothetical protein [Verrucomicrobiota bacterium]
MPLSKQLKDYLTTEPLKRRFDDTFDLVNYAISLGKESIKQGRLFHTQTDVHNQAYQILEEIFEEKDRLPPPPPKPKPEPQPQISAKDESDD